MGKKPPERKFIEGPLEVDGDGRTVSGYASVFGNVDWADDVVEPGAFAKTLQERGNKVRVLWQHDPDKPLGRLLEAREDGHGLFVKFRISATSYGDDALILLRDSALGGMSIAYDVLAEDYERQAEGKTVRHIKEMRLWEVSLVTFPANEAAVVTGIKAVGAATNLPLADRDHAWDADAAMGRLREWAGGSAPEDMDWAQYRKAFFWYDDEEPELLASYKLPFCDVIDGKPHAVPRGVFAVAAALQGARGGVDLPADDEPEVRRRVETYYARMRREFDDDTIRAPWEEAAESPPAKEGSHYEPVEGGGDAPERKEGRVLSGRNVARLREALTALEEILREAERDMDEEHKGRTPPGDESRAGPPAEVLALTRRRLQLRAKLLEDYLAKGER